MKKVLFLLLLFFSSQFSASAQSDFLKGFLQGMAEGFSKSNSSSSTTQSSKVGSGSTQRNYSNSGSSGNKRKEVLNGGFVIVEEFPTYQIRTRWGLCPNCHGAKSCNMCHGTGNCSFCKGRGICISEATGNVLSTCVACNQTGRCSLCKGKKKCVCNDGEYPGYAIYEIKHIDDKGNEMFDSKANYNERSNNSSSSRRSSSRSSSSRGACSRCGGTGVNPEQSPKGGLASWVAYYHSGGSKCGYCGKYNEHVHEKCSTCNTPTH